MKFISIELENFRQFYGTQKVVFSIDPYKNITVIHAENGTGKTAFLNAIMWCLFNTTTENFNDPKNIINKIAKYEGHNGYAVAIEFISDNGDEFLVRRSHKLNDDVFQVFQIIEGDYGTPIDKPASFINSIIPKDMAKYFFFQGEGIGKISSSNGSQVVKQAIREILGFTIAERALDDVRSIRKEYRRALTSADKSGDLSKKQLEIDRLEEGLEGYSEQIKKFSASCAMFEEKLRAIDTQLENSNSATIKQLHLRRGQIEQALKREKQLQIDSLRDKKTLISEFAVSTFGHSLSKEVLDFIDEKEYEGSIPAPFNEQLVHDIIKNKSCICGAAVHEGTDAFKCIQEMLKNAADPMLENRISKARSQLTVIKNSLVRAEVSFDRNIKNQFDSAEKIKEYQGKLSEISVEISGAESIETVKNLENERVRLKNSLEQDRRNLIKAELSQSQAQPKLNSLEAEIKRLSSFDREVDKYNSLISVAESVENLLENTIKNAEKDIERVLITKVNDYLSRFVRQEYSAKLNSQTFSIRLVDSNDQFVPESDGQSLLLNLTFIASLIEISRERKNASGQILTPGAVAPFVVDAPFGDLDNKYKGHVAQAIPNSVNQVVFLLSSSHWEGSVESNIRAKVGKEYNMVLEESAGKKHKGADYIDILGRKYETVRYDCAKDKTLIEEVGSYV